MLTYVHIQFNDSSYDGGSLKKIIVYFIKYHNKLAMYELKADNTAFSWMVNDEAYNALKKIIKIYQKVVHFHFLHIGLLMIKQLIILLLFIKIIIKQ